MKKALKTFWHYYLVVVVYLLLAFLLFRAGLAAQKDFTGISLRYTEMPLAAGTASNVKDMLQDPSSKEEFVPAFWYETRESYISLELAGAQADILYADGEMRGLYPANFIYGTYPGAYDSRGVAVSESLAWELWGGGDLVGKSFVWDEKTYYIRGIFEGTENVMLVQVNASSLGDGGAFTGAHLYGNPEGDMRTAAEAFAQNTGLGIPSQIIETQSMGSLLMFMALAPLVVLGVWFIVKMLGAAKRLPFWPKQIIWFVALLSLAALLPKLLDLLPAWIIPNKWSDFDAWSGFFSIMSTRVEEWLSVKPSYCDVMLKMALLGQAVLMVMALFAVTAAIGVWGRKLQWLLFDRPVSAKEPVVVAVPQARDRMADSADEIGTCTSDELDIIALKESDTDHFDPLAELYEDSDGEIDMLGEDSRLR